MVEIKPCYFFFFFDGYVAGECPCWSQKILTEEFGGCGDIPLAIHSQMFQGGKWWLWTVTATFL